MRIGEYEIHDGALLLGGFTLLVAVLLLITWVRNSGDLDQQKSLAIEKGWRWMSNAPPELQQPLDQLRSNVQRWKASKIMEVSGIDGKGYLFQLNRASTSGFNETAMGRIETQACLIPGPTIAKSTIIRIDRMPFDTVKAAIELSNITIEGLGSTEFQRNFMISLEGVQYEDEAHFEAMGDRTAIDAMISRVKIAPELETELNRWFRPIGQPVAWSEIYMRDSLVMVTKNSTSGFLSAKEWQQLLQMCQGLSRAIS